MPRNTKTRAEYHGGRIKGLIEAVAKAVAADPKKALNLDLLHAELGIAFKGYGDRKNCFNCGRHMEIAIYTADLHDGLLLYAVARAVRENIRKGIPFTDANKIHIPTLNATDAIRKRNAKCGYLNILKQPEGMKNSGYWIITSWGWELLRGGEIPEKAYYWNGQLIRRSEEKTSLAKMFATHTETVKRALERRKEVKADHRSKYSDYNPSEWIDYAPPLAAGF